MRLALLAITASALFAQGPEVRGVVLEQGPGVPLPGVEVSLTANPGPNARVIGTVFTDANGGFLFKPETFGQYQIALKKTGYSLPRAMFTPTTLFLSAGFPSWQPRFIMMNPGSIAGRFLDENDAPIAGLHAVLQDALPPGIANYDVVTDPDGTFSVSGVSPGPYFVRAVSSLRDLPRIEDYTDEAFKQTDHGYEDLFWPSGVRDERDAVPLIVPPGGAARLGTIHLRQTERYRVRVNIQGDCSGNQWSMAIVSLPRFGTTLNDLTSIPGPCKQQILMTNVPAGTFQFALWADGANIRWAIAPLLITRSNTTVNLTIAAAMDVPGRVVTSEGVPPPPVTGSNFLLMMRPDIHGLSDTDAQEPQVQPDLTFVAHTLRWDRYRVSVPRAPAGYYVREIRYNGRPVTDGRIDLLPKAQLEFELDNQPAQVSGTVTEGGQPFIGPAVILIAKAPFDVATVVESKAPFSYLGFSQVGRFEVTGLAPGEYRIAVARDPAQLPQAILVGETLTLGHGQQATIELKLTR